MSSEMPLKHLENESIPQPTEEQIRIYFYRLGLKLRSDLRKLREFDPPASGGDAKVKGWFVGYHSTVEAAVALKICEYAGLPEEEKNLLVQAVMLDEIHKRKLYESGRHDSSLGRKETRAEAEDILKNQYKGIDPRVLEIGRGIGADFTNKFVEGKLNSGSDNDRMIARLEGYLSVIHNSVDTKISTVITAGKRAKMQTTEIVSWKLRIQQGREDNPAIAQEMIEYNGKPIPLLDAEELSNDAMEADIKRRINERAPGTISESEPLWQFVRNEIMKDIAKIFTDTI